MSIKPATKEQMLEKGFPETIQKAFKNTAEETQCIILTRVPGGATTELIAAGHDLKGYFIKAKSCDWGPMSGFLCQVPAFNKRGVAGIKDNVEKNLEYCNKFCDRLHGAQEGSLAGTAPGNGAEAIEQKFRDNKLLYQKSDWNSILFRDKKPTDKIGATRLFLRDKSNEDVVAELLKPIATGQKELFTDDPTSGDLSKSETLDKFKHRLSLVVHDLRVLLGDDSPFVPLKLTEKVFKKFRASPNTEYTATIGADAITCGVAYKKMGEGISASLVWFKYIVKKNQQGLYELYHGDVGVYDAKKKWRLENYVRNELNINEKEQLRRLGISWDCQSGQKVTDFCGNNAQEVVRTINQKNKSFIEANPFPSKEEESVEAESFYPIKGIQNYYPPFSGDDAYKNAVTGDYDLFACWLKITSGGLEDLVRQSELAPAPDALFSRMSSKPHSLRSNVSKNVFVEFIPTFNELKESKVDHPSFGNSNGLVHLVAGTLNSFVNVGEARGGRNVTFHGDEGGRPEINKVDYDVAVFVPAALMATGSVATCLNSDKKNAQMFIIKKHDELLTLIKAVKSECYVPLNFAWVYDFLESNDDEVKKLLKAVLCSGEEHNQAEQLSSLKEKFEQVFKPEDINKSSEEKMNIIMGQKTENN
jgi:hypothetical protein